MKKFSAILSIIIKVLLILILSFYLFLSFFSCKNTVSAAEVFESSSFRSSYYLIPHLDSEYYNVSYNIPTSNISPDNLHNSHNISPIDTTYNMSASFGFIDGSSYGYATVVFPFSSNYLLYDSSNSIVMWGRQYSEGFYDASNRPFIGYVFCDYQLLSYYDSDSIWRPVSSAPSDTFLLWAVNKNLSVVSCRISIVDDTLFNSDLSTLSYSDSTHLSMAPGRYVAVTYTIADEYMNYYLLSFYISYSSSYSSLPYEEFIQPFIDSGAEYAAGYDVGYYIGYNEASNNISQISYDYGYNDGYGIGYIDGSSVAFEDVTPFQVIKDGIDRLLDIEIFPGVKLYVPLLISFGLILFGLVIKILYHA